MLTLFKLLHEVRPMEVVETNASTWAYKPFYVSRTEGS
jgi:hypothetical protein